MENHRNEPERQLPGGFEVVKYSALRLTSLEWPDTSAMPLRRLTARAAFLAMKWLVISPKRPIELLKKLLPI